MDKKVLIIAGCVAGGLAIAGGVTAAIVLNTPESLLVRAAANTVKDYKNLEWYQICDDVANGGSVEFKANLEPMVDEDLYFSTKVYENAAKGNGAVVVSFQDEDQESLATFNAAYNKDSLTFSFPEADDEVYGFDLKNIEDNLNHSPFDPDDYDPYDYTGNSSKYALVGKYLESMGSNVEADTKLQSMAEGLEEKYRTLVLKELVAGSDVTKSSETVTVGSDSISCTVVTVELDEDQICDILLNVLEYAEDDQELEDYVDLCAANSEAYDEDFADQFYDELDEAQDEIEDYFDDATMDVTIRFYISKVGTKIVKIDLEYEAENDNADYYDAQSEEIEMSLVLGKSIESVGEKSLTLDVSEVYETRKEDTSVELIFDIEQNNNSAFIATMSIASESAYSYTDYEDTYNDTYEVTGEFEWDKKTGEFTIDFETEKSEWQDYAPYFSLELNMLDKGDTRTIIIEEIDYGSGYKDSYDYYSDTLKMIEDMEITIILDRNDKAPSPAKDFTELTELDEDDIDEILEDYADELDDIFEDYDMNL